jgi:CheY-like chemotaxis protein
LKPLRRLPLRQVLHNQKTELLNTTAPTPAVTERTSGAVGLRILLAEDNIVNQRLISPMLQKMGHAVVVANDGAAALLVLSEQEFDVIAMDMQMPLMDGLEASQKIRLNELGTARHLPIVAITANCGHGWLRGKTS